MKTDLALHALRHLHGGENLGLLSTDAGHLARAASKAAPRILGQLGSQLQFCCGGAGLCAVPVGVRGELISRGLRVRVLCLQMQQGSCCAADVIMLQSAMYGSVSSMSKRHAHGMSALAWGRHDNAPDWHLQLLELAVVSLFPPLLLPRKSSFAADLSDTCSLSAVRPVQKVQGSLA